MSEKVVLPKFDLPGQGPHPAVRVLQVIAGLLGTAVLVLGLAMWRHHSQQLAAEARAQALIAARAAEAAAVVEAAKARAAEAAAKIAAANAAASAAKAAALAAKSGTSAAGAPTGTDSKGADGKTLAAVHHHGHHRATTLATSSKTTKTLAKADDKAPSRPGSKRDDAAIDKLLASFNKK